MKVFLCTLIGISFAFFCSNLQAERRYNTAKSNSSANRSLQKNPADALNLKEIPKNLHYLVDPTNQEFWKEGNHIPDQGFTTFAMNPNENTAALYLIRYELKAKRLGEMYPIMEKVYFNLMKSGHIKDRYGLLKHSVRQMKPSYKISNKRLPFPDTVIYFLFDPSCGVCKRQSKELSKIKEDVLALQVSGKKLKNFSNLYPSDWADKETIADYVKGSVPVILVYNFKLNKISPFPAGFRTVPEIIEAAKKLIAQ